MFSRDTPTDGAAPRGRVGPEAAAALPILAALLPAAANQGHPGTLQTCCQAGGSRVPWARGRGASRKRAPITGSGAGGRRQGWSFRWAAVS